MTKLFNHQTGHLTTEAKVAFADRTLPRAQAAKVIEHVANCAECNSALREAMENADPERMAAIMSSDPVAALAKEMLSKVFGIPAEEITLIGAVSLKAAPAVKKHDPYNGKAPTLPQAIGHLKDCDRCRENYLRHFKQYTPEIITEFRAAPTKYAKQLSDYKFILAVLRGLGIVDRDPNAPKRRKEETGKRATSKGGRVVHEDGDSASVTA